MELHNPLLIVVDPAHGGRDPGATWGGRQEKDDSLRLGAALREALVRQGVDPLMTRDTDLFVPLQDRVNLANANNADLFISLHRAFSPDAVAAEYGVQNNIYLTAPEVTTACVATQVLNAIAEVGVQANRGISLTNQYVLRRTQMSAMLLEMGFINNDEDNRLFDIHLQDYAEAIVKGLFSYFGVVYSPPATEAAPPAMGQWPLQQPQWAVNNPQWPQQSQVAPTEQWQAISPAQQQTPSTAQPPAQTPNMAQQRPQTPSTAQQPAQTPSMAQQPAQTPSTTPQQPMQSVIPSTQSQRTSSTASSLVRSGQQALNRIFGAGLAEDGIYGPLTKRAAVRAMQTLINDSRGGSLAVDGVLDANTRALLPVLRQGDRGNGVSLLQILLALNGYDPGPIDGIFGPRTRTAVTLFQRDHFLVPDGVAGPRTLSYLLR